MHLFTEPKTTIHFLQSG